MHVVMVVPDYTSPREAIGEHRKRTVFPRKRIPRPSDSLALPLRGTSRRLSVQLSSFSVFPTLRPLMHGLRAKAAPRRRLRRRASRQSSLTTFAANIVGLGLRGPKGCFHTRNIGWDFGRGQGPRVSSRQLYLRLASWLSFAGCLSQIPSPPAAISFQSPDHLGPRDAPEIIMETPWIVHARHSSLRTT
jgi:hypothetical protein